MINKFVTTTMNSTVQVGANGLSFIAIGLLSSTFVLVTNNFDVYEQPRELLQSKEFLRDAVPVPMSEKWPKLYADKQFQAIIQNRLLSVFTLYGNDGDYIFFCVSRRFGILYHIDNGEVLRGLRFADLSNPLIALLPDSEQMVIYNIEREEQGLTMNKFRPNSQSIRYITNIKREEGPLLMCDKGNKISLQRNTENCHTFKWTKINGFVYNEIFYLFTDNNVTVFSTTVFTSKLSVEYWTFPIDNRQLPEQFTHFPVTRLHIRPTRPTRGPRPIRPTRGTRFTRPSPEPTQEIGSPFDFPTISSFKPQHITNPSTFPVPLEPSLMPNPFPIIDSSTGKKKFLTISISNHCFRFRFHLESVHNEYEHLCLRDLQSIVLVLYLFMLLLLLLGQIISIRTKIGECARLQQNLVAIIDSTSETFSEISKISEIQINRSSKQPGQLSEQAKCSQLLPGK